MPTQNTNMTDPCAVSSLLTEAAQAMQSAKGRVGCMQHLPGSGKMLVTGDLHDNPFNYGKIVKLSGLDSGEDHHLVLQELIHSDKLVGGVDMSFRMLVRVAALVLEYPNQVHPLLANHELSQLTRRGITKGHGNVVEMFNAGVEWAFGSESEMVCEAIDTFILAMPLAAKSSSGLMCCHSLPNARLMSRFDKDIFSRSPTDEDRDGTDGSASLLVWGRLYTEEQVDELSTEWDVKLFCLGHAHVPDGAEVAMKNILLLNSDHDQGAVLPVDLGDIPDAETAIWSVIKLSALPVEPDHAS